LEIANWRRHQPKALDMQLPAGRPCTTDPNIGCH
jgi:hypothetical protein